MLLGNRLECFVANPAASRGVSCRTGSECHVHGSNYKKGQGRIEQFHNVVVRPIWIPLLPQVQSWFQWTRNRMMAAPLMILPVPRPKES